MGVRDSAAVLMLNWLFRKGAWIEVEPEEQTGAAVSGLWKNAQWGLESRVFLFGAAMSGGGCGQLSARLDSGLKPEYFPLQTSYLFLAD